MDTRKTVSGRRTRACVECNSKKLRCLPSEDTPEICRRCYETGRECVIPGNRPRQPRVPLVKRIEQLERRLSDVVKTGKNNTCTSSSAARLDIGNGNAKESDTPMVADSMRQSAVFNTRNGILHDIIDMKLLSVEQADILCNRYRNCAQFNFPYVILGTEYTASYLRANKPMLFLAIMTVTCWRQRSLQLVLEQEYLRNLSNRVIIQGEKTLDILQSLLIYVGWYHFFSSSQRHLIQMLCTLSSGILVDLGYDRSERDTGLDGYLKSPGSAFPFSQSKPSVLLKSHDREIERALLGCYVLTTWSVITYRQGHHLPWTAYIEQCAISLATDPEVPSDLFLEHYTSLTHIAGKVHSVLSGRNGGQDAEQIRSYLRSIGKELQLWKDSLPFSLSENFSLEMTYDFIVALSHSVPSINTGLNRPSSNFRMSTVTKSFRSAKAIITKALAYPASTMAPWTFPSWGKLISSLVLLNQLSEELKYLCDTQPQSISLEVESLARALGYRAEELFQQTHTPPNQEHWFEQLSKNLKSFNITSSNTDGTKEHGTAWSLADIQKAEPAGRRHMDMHQSTSNSLDRMDVWESFNESEDRVIDPFADFFNLMF